MNNFNTELFQALSQGYSIDEIIRSEVESTINHLLKSELTAFLDYEPYDPIGYNSGNSRNGSYKRTVKTKYGEIQVDIGNGLRSIGMSIHFLNQISDF